MLNKLVTPILLLFTNVVWAQQIIDPQLNYPIQQALINNYELKNKTLEANKSIISSAIIHAKKLPEISANAVYTHIYTQGILDIPTLTFPISGIELFQGNQSFNLNANIVNTGILAKQVIFSGLQINNAEKALKEKAQAETLLAESGKDAIAKEVISSFDQLMLLNEAEKLIAETEKRLEKENLRVITAIQNGLAVPYDRDKINLALLELSAKKIELKGNRKLLYHKLEQTTHIDMDKLKTIQYNLEAITFLENKWSPEHRLELKALEHAQLALDYNLKKEKGTALPTIFAFGQAAYTNIFNSQLSFNHVGNIDKVNLKLDQLSMLPNVFVGIGAKWDIFAGGAHREKIALVKTDIEINKNKQLATREQLNLLIEKSKIDYDNASEKIKINKQKMQLSENNMMMASKQYQEGLINITERLASENDWFKSSLDFYMQVVEQRNASLELLKANGTLLNKILK